MENKTTAACHGGGDDPDPFLLLLLHLPEDFFIQILLRLPIQSLLRFKSVCKSWHALIQTSFFIDLHVNSSSSSNFGSFILRTDHFTSEDVFYLKQNLSEDVILMLSEYGGHEYGDWYRCTDGSWHKFTTDGSGYKVTTDDGSWHKYCTTDGDGSWPKLTACGDGGDWHWDNANCGWYWINSGRHGGDWYYTNCGWYWVSDARDRLWDDTDGRWYYQDEVFKVDDDDDDQLRLKVDNLELPSCYNKSTSRKVIAGSCNGLVCLYDFKLRDVSLWNPATRQFRILPKSITIKIDDDDDDDFVHSSVDFVAFGFDVKTKDYKVLLITTNSRPSPKNFYDQVQVYSLSTDSWRPLEVINSPWTQPTEHHGLYMNGRCFFIVNVYHPESNNINNRFINSFDFTKEIFTTMQLPDHDIDRHDLFLRCFGDGEKMALFTILRKTSSGKYEDSDDEHHDGYYDEDCDIWVLNEHGSGCGGVNNESWTKLHSFQIKDGSCPGGSRPIGISNNGKFAFLEIVDTYRRIQYVYNLVTKEVKLDIPFCVSMSKVYVYKPSLVSIGNGCSSIIPAIR